MQLAVLFYKKLISSQTAWSPTGEVNWSQEAKLKMARGWESKDVESQITGARSAVNHGNPHDHTVVERERINKRTSLMLDRSRVTSELNTARNERFRLQLRAELEFINRQFAALEPQA
jgi:hypothetical protein